MQIRIRHHDGREESIELDAARTIRLGRRSSADVVIGGPGVRSLHLGILARHGAFTAVAFKRVGKIRVNGRLVRKAVLQDGDRIQAGENWIEVVGTQPEPVDRLAKGSKPHESRQNRFRTSTAREETGEYPGDQVLDDLSRFNGVADLPGNLPDDPQPIEVQELAVDEVDVPEWTRIPAPVPTTPAAGAFLRSRWFHTSIILLVVTPLAVLIGLYIHQLPTVEERFLVADQFYQRGDFPNAAESFGTFLSRHTDDVHRDEARVKHDLSLLLNSMDRGVGAERLLERTVKSVVEWGTNSRCAYAQAGLAQLLPPLVADLTRRGQQFAEQGEDELADQSLRQAGQALAMIYQHIPSELQRTCGVEQLQLHVTRLRRKIRQPSVLRDALRRIEEDGTIEGIEAAYALRAGLLNHYPDFASDGRLLAAMRAVGRAECARVRSLAGFDNAGTGTSQSVWMKQVVVESAPESDVDEKDPPVAAVLLRHLGCVYALNASSGRTLWRYPVGFGTTCAPVPLDSGSFLLMDTMRGQLIRVNRDTGWPDWHLPTRPLAGQPIVDDGRLVVACNDGTVTLADLNRGAAIRALQLPQSLSVGPVADPVAARCYQIAEHSLIYVLADDQTTCLSSYYLGHDAAPSPWLRSYSTNTCWCSSKLGRSRQRFTCCSAVISCSRSRLSPLPSVSVAPPRQLKACSIFRPRNTLCKCCV